MANRYTLTEQQKIIDIYLNGCVNLYGYVTPRQFLKVYNRYNTPKILKEDLLKWADKLERQTDNYAIYTNAIINTKVSDEKINKIIYYQNGKTYYTPTAEEITAYSSPNYYAKTKQTEELYNFVTKELNISTLIANVFIKNLEWSIRIEEPMQAQNDLMESCGIIPKNIVQARSLFEKIQNINNSTRKWANCGYTPQELFKNIKD